jgi:hypothetical protein
LEELRIVKAALAEVTETLDVTGHGHYLSTIRLTSPNPPTYAAARLDENGVPPIAIGRRLARPREFAMSAATDNLELIADPVLAKKLGRSLRTLARWDDDPSLGFPKPVVINKRKYRRVHEVEAWLNKRALASLDNGTKRKAAGREPAESESL